MRQLALIEKVRTLCRDDARIVAALMYGSFARGEGDRFSDVEFYLFLRHDDLAELDRRAWAERIAPIEAAFENEYGTYVAIFEDLVRCELHFEGLGRIRRLESWQLEPSDVDAMLSETLAGLDIKPSPSKAPPSPAAEEGPEVSTAREEPPAPEISTAAEEPTPG